MNESFNIIVEAEKFLSRFLNIYLEHRDFSAVKKLLDDDITWLGIGEQDICHNYNETLTYLDEESKLIDIHFTISNPLFHSAVIAPTLVNISGEFKLTEKTNNEASFVLCVRLSAICSYFDGVWKLLQIHFSTPNDKRNAMEFIPHGQTSNYNILLEKTIGVRTKKLKEKTAELESLTNNICGGVQVCSYDKDFTIKYISSGFTRLTGYTEGDLKRLFDNSHLLLISKQDIEGALAEVSRQLADSNRFSVEYRLVRKDGSTIWVADNGYKSVSEDGTADLQSILTDITQYKIQEESLRLSQKRFEIILRQSNISVFEYDLITGDLLLHDDIAKMYNVGTVVPNGVETFIEKVIEPVSISEYREMYRKIHAGAPSARCLIKTKDADGIVRDFELHLTNMFNSSGKPIRAIGIRKSITDKIDLLKEKNFNKNFVANRTLILEADITSNNIDYINPEWKSRLGDISIIDYDITMKHIIETLIDTSFVKLYTTSLSRKNIISRHKKGENLITFEYQTFDGKIKGLWFEAIINIIKEPLTNNITIRVYRMDISETKLRQEKANEEQHIYETMLSKAIRAYEFNITKNLVIKGQDFTGKACDIITTNYSVMLTELSKGIIHKDDFRSFFAMFNRESVLQQYHNGVEQFTHQNRMLDNDEKYIWTQCIMHLYEDPTTSDIKGFCYIEDIDKRKRQEIELKYNAEHDIMTEMFNKSTTESLIESYLSSPSGSTGVHAFIIIDIDNFKNVNDSFGHLFGDGVIKDIARKITSFANKDCIVGRIGGDEFAMFVKNFKSLSDLGDVATAISDKITTSYTVGVKSFTISASCGISIYGENGKNFNELYDSADAALYVAKNNGKRTFAFATKPNA